MYVGILTRRCYLAPLSLKGGSCGCRDFKMYPGWKMTKMDVKTKKGRRAQAPTPLTARHRFRTPPTHRGMVAFSSSILQSNPLPAICLRHHVHGPKTPRKYPATSRSPHQRPRKMHLENLAIFTHKRTSPSALHRPSLLVALSGETAVGVVAAPVVLVFEGPAPAGGWGRTRSTDSRIGSARGP